MKNGTKNKINIMYEPWGYKYTTMASIFPQEY